MFEKKNENNTKKLLMYIGQLKDLQSCYWSWLQLNGEIKKADEVQIDGEADVVMKTDNLVVGVTGNCKGTY